MRMKSLLGEQQIQQQQIQENQQKLKDNQAVTDAWKSWDGKDTDSLVKGVLSAGGSGAAANTVAQTLMARQQEKNALSESDFTLQQKKTDRMLGRFDAAEAVPDEQLVPHIQSALKDSVTSGDLDPQHAQAAQQLLQQAGTDPKSLRAGLDNFKKSYQLESVQFSRAKEQAETDKNNAQAAKDNADAFLARNKAGVMNAYKANPQSLLDQVDAIAPANKYGSLNQRTKAGIHNAIMNGDIDGAKELIKEAGTQVGAVEKDVAVATNPDIQRGKVEVAAAEGAARAAQEAKTARGSNAALAQVPPHLVAPASAQAAKAGEDYAQAQSVTQRLNAMMKAATKGNVVAYQVIPEEGTLQITTSQGVHRINQAEIEQYAGGGSLWQRMMGHVGKQLTGASIPSSVLDDMAEIQKIQADGSKLKYNNSLKTINQTYGANFQPVEMDEMKSGQPTKPAAPTGATHTAMGSDKKLHYTNAKGEDLGLAE